MSFGILSVDYILFLTADVSVTPNPNEIKDHKYVSKEELQAMFQDPSMFPHPMLLHDVPLMPHIENSFTPWFKLIARDFLFGWWDELISRRGADGKLAAKSLAGLVDGSKVVKM